MRALRSESLVLEINSLLKMRALHSYLYLLTVFENLNR